MQQEPLSMWDKMMVRKYRKKRGGDDSDQRPVKRPKISVFVQEKLRREEEMKLSRRKKLTLEKEVARLKKQMKAVREKEIERAKERGQKRKMTRVDENKRREQRDAERHDRELIKQQLRQEREEEEKRVSEKNDHSKLDRDRDYLATVPLKMLSRCEKRAFYIFEEDIPRRDRVGDRVLEPEARAFKTSLREA